MEATVAEYAGSAYVAAELAYVMVTVVERQTLSYEDEEAASAYLSSEAEA